MLIDSVGFGDGAVGDMTPNVRWPGIEIFHLILETDTFIVFIDNAIDVDWVTSDAYDVRGHKDAVRHNEILNRAAGLECVPNDHHKENIRLNFKRMVGEGVARSLDDDYDSAIAILDKAEAYITDRNVETARFWQLSTACILCGIAAFIALLSWNFRERLLEAWGASAYFLFVAGCAGSMGAALSMIFRMGNSFPTSEAPKGLHILESISRILAGFLSGVLVSGAVTIGIILSVIAEAGKLHIGLLVIGFASGASERLAPSLIAKIETSSGDTGKIKGAKR